MNRRKSMQFWFRMAILVMLVVPKALRGQASAANRPLSGGVQDTSGAVVAGAQVSLDRPDGTEFAHTITDSTGGFRFKNLPTGSYVVDVQQPGFRETKAPVTVDATARPSLRIILPVAAVEERVTVGAADSSGQVSTE